MVFILNSVQLCIGLCDAAETVVFANLIHVQLAEQQAALAAAERKLADASTHGPDCACPLAQQLRSECGRLHQEVEQLRSAAAAAQQQSEVRVTQTAMRGQAQLQGGWLVGGQNFGLD